MRFWVDDTYIGQLTGTRTTPTDGSSGLDVIHVGDYWNGDFWQSTHFYWGDVIVTRETPNTLDSGGRPYISPSTRVSDFA